MRNVDLTQRAAHMKFRTFANSWSQRYIMTMWTYTIFREIRLTSY